MSDRVLELRGVSHAFGGLTVLEKLDLDVDRREIVCEGHNIAGMPSHKINRLGIARTFQTLRLFLNMSVKENVMAVQYGKTRAGIFRAVLRTPAMRREERTIHE